MQVVPHRQVRRREIEVALPDPGHRPFWEMAHQRKRLRVVHDYGVAGAQMKPGGILEHHLFVEFLLDGGDLDALALQRVMQLLRAAEEGWRSLDQVPLCFEADRIDAAAI